MLNIARLLRVTLRNFVVRQLRSVRTSIACYTEAPSLRLNLINDLTTLRLIKINNT